MSRHLASSRSVADVTRGGWAPTGTSAARRDAIVKAPGPKASRTRQRLLDAARVVFAEHGYLDSTIEHIVAEAGVSRGSFYTYFESKTEVFRHLVAMIDDAVDSRVAHVDRTTDDDVVGRLLASNRSYLEVVRNNADLYRLVDQVAAYDDRVSAARLRSHRRHVARVAKTIGRWQASGVADPSVDATATAAALVAMLSSSAHWIHVDGDRSDADPATTLTSIWVRACGLRASKVSP